MQPNRVAECAIMPGVGQMPWGEAERGSPGRPDSRSLRRRLVLTLQAEGHLRSERVAAAFEAIPRELFVPGVDLDEAYRSGEAIVTKRVNGVGVSSASAPNVMAIMLEQLDPGPGDHVLEIGAGTGYNAALLAHIVGPSGSVTTLDIDEDIVAAARKHLQAAGFHDVAVLTRDGALGGPEGRAFDRIILTVGSPDIAPAWREQLARPDGRLVLPLRLRGPQRSIAFRLEEEGHLVSTSVQACQFIPLRGLLAASPVLFQADSGAAVSITPPNENLLTSPDRISDVLALHRHVWPTGVSATLDDIRDALHVWLVVREPSVCTLYAEAGVRAVPNLFGSAERVRGSLGIVCADGLALLGWSAGPRSAVLHGARELSVEAPEASAAQAERLVGLIRAWQAAGRPGDAQLQIRAYARGQAPAPGPDEVVLDERWTRFLVRWRSDRTV
jgi:protein-L-isoaspartate(D-aspartate) O-methyltransferase